MAESDVSSLPSLKSVKEYLWVKYVDFGSSEMEMDEDAATQLLEEHHRSTPIAEDGENYYLGIALFENAENHPEKRKRMLAGARHIFTAYRERTGETDWDPIEDRLLDIADALDGLSEEEQKKLLEAAAEEYAFVREAAAADEPEEEETPGMILVPSGPFLSGPTKGLKETGAFWMDTYPVTNEQFAAFCQETGYRHPKFWAEGRMRAPRAPVVGVSWFDAYKYAAWAGKSLPTRDQWEKAARGKTGRLYPWGDEIDHNKAVYGQTDGSDAVSEVGTCPENVSEYGAREMVGNVWEWTDSWDREEPEMKVVAGGSWCDPVEFLRLDKTLATNPKDKFDNIGFRCVRAAE